jgi:hypothetical protein
VTVHSDKLRIKQPTRCIKYPKFILSLNFTCFGHLLCPSSGVIYCTLGNWYVSCRLCDRYLAESGWNCVPSWLLGSGHQKLAWNLPIAQFTVDNSWWWAQKMSETCRVLWQNKFWIFVASSWLFYTRLITMHGHILNIDATCRWVGQFHDQATLFPMRILFYPLYGRISGRFGQCRRWKIPAATGNWYCFFISQPSTVRIEQMWTACKRAWEAWR